VVGGLVTKFFGWLFALGSAKSSSVMDDALTDKLIEEMDQDGSGTVTREEWLAVRVGVFCASTFPCARSRCMVGGGRVLISSAQMIVCSWQSHCACNTSRRMRSLVNSNSKSHYRKCTISFQSV
jgi:hypothetical protein